MRPSASQADAASVNNAVAAQIAAGQPVMPMEVGDGRRSAAECDAGTRRDGVHPISFGGTARERRTRIGPAGQVQGIGFPVLSECRTVERDEADGKRGKSLHDSIALRPFPAAFAA